MYFTGGTSLLSEARPYYRVLGEGESHPKAPLLPLPQERGKEKLSRLPVLATASSPSCICLSPSLLMGTVINRSFSLCPAGTLGQAFSSSWCLRESRSAAWLTAALRLPFHLKLLHGHSPSSTYIMILGHRLDVIRLPDHRWSPSSSLLSQLWRLTRSLPHPDTFCFFHPPPHTPNGALFEMPDHKRRHSFSRSPPAFSSNFRIVPHFCPLGFFFFFSSSTSKIYVLLVQGAGPEMNMPFMGQLFAKSPNVCLSTTHCSNLSMKNEEIVANCLSQNLTPYFTVTWKLAGSSGGTAAKEAPGMGTGSSKWNLVTPVTSESK